MSDEGGTFVFKKKRKRRGNIRQKTLDEPPEEERKPAEDEEENKKTKGDDTDNDDDNDNDNDADDEANDGEDGQSSVIRPDKKTKKENPFVQSTKKLARELHKSHMFASERSGKSTSAEDGGATILMEENKGRDQNQPKWKGPMKSIANVRIISRFDYQPDLCKDYNETGYCGYGDSCKFMHDRGDYKSGWQLEKEWEAEQEKKRREMMGEDVSDEEDFRIDSDEDDYPFACLICREDFDTPVVTQCKHYFCEKCALKSYTQNTKCYVCNEQTHGIFNTADKLLANLDKIKRKKDEEKRKAEDERKNKEQIQSESSGGWNLGTTPDVSSSINI